MSKLKIVIWNCLQTELLIKIIVEARQNQHHIETCLYLSHNLDKEVDFPKKRYRKVVIQLKYLLYNLTFTISVFNFR